MSQEIHILKQQRAFAIHVLAKQMLFNLQDIEKLSEASNFDFADINFMVIKKKTRDLMENSRKYVEDARKIYEQIGLNERRIAEAEELRRMR